MRDVSNKQITFRTARAVATITVGSAALEAIQFGTVPKGDPFSVAKVAAIQAAKKTNEIIPFCHQIQLDFIDVRFQVDHTREGTRSCIKIETEVKAIWKTGVEMEALLAASTAALTVYDMLKMLDDSMVIGEVKLLEKKGGKSDLQAVPRQTLRAGVLVSSDAAAAGKREDISGRDAVERLKKEGFNVEVHKVVPDERNIIERELTHWCDELKLDLIITTGGTGLSLRDVTPEATKAVIQREAPGIVEILRASAQSRTRTSMLSRGVAGSRGKTLIVNLPGSPKAVDESLHVLFPTLWHAFDMLQGRGH